MQKTKDMFEGIGSSLELMTHRSGKFVFQIGVDYEKVKPLIDRVEDAHARFLSVPILPQVANQLQKTVIVSSVFGTNTIEGGTLTEDEIEEIFGDAAPPEDIREEKERRVTNIKDAYDFAESLSSELEESNMLAEGEYGIPIELEEELVLELHRLITNALTHPNNVPGEYRDNPKGFYTRVGDVEHGGTYTPPKCFDDIQLLMNALIQWINSEQIISLPPLIRAPLLHYYFERVHPFWDGNGRVGRVLEAIVLKSSGMMYAPFALARNYLEHFDEYFTVFNTARRLEGKNGPYPNTPFVEFFLHRLIEVFSRLHDQVNGLIGIILFENFLNHCLQEKKINLRQYTVVDGLLARGYTFELSKVQKMSWYKALYRDLTRRTRDRDIRKLIDIEILKLDKNGQLRLNIPGGIGASLRA